MGLFRRGERADGSEEKPGEVGDPHPPTACGDRGPRDDEPSAISPPVRQQGSSAAERIAPTSFRVKICGITSVENAVAVCQAGADAIGLNFYRPSPRSIDLDLAGQIVREIPKRVIRVGLFVNATDAEIREAADRLDLDLIQLHGDESAERLVTLRDLPIMRALRIGQGGLAPVAEYLAACGQLDAMPRLVLLDALSMTARGGTGQTFDWSVAAGYRTIDAAPPLVLAGGIRPENVADAILTAAPAAVDAASGVEISPGVKDPEAVARLVRNARAAFDVSR